MASFDPSRLLVQLQNTGLQNRDQPTFQLLSQMIKALSGVNTQVNVISNTPTTVVPELTPYFIAAGDTFTVPEFEQALFSMNIDNEGMIEVDGFLIEVDGIPNSILAKIDKRADILGLDGLDGEDGLSIPGPRGLQGIQGDRGIPGEDGLDSDNPIITYSSRRFSLESKWITKTNDTTYTAECDGFVIASWNGNNLGGFQNTVNGIVDGVTVASYTSPIAPTSGEGTSMTFPVAKGNTYRLTFIPGAGGSTLSLGSMFWVPIDTSF